jgi:hypothetical protein
MSQTFLKYSVNGERLFLSLSNLFQMKFSPELTQFMVILDFQLQLFSGYALVLCIFSYSHGNSCQLIQSSRFVRNLTTYSFLNREKFLFFKALFVGCRWCFKMLK